MTWSA